MDIGAVLEGASTWALGVRRKRLRVGRMTMAMGERWAAKPQAIQYRDPKNERTVTAKLVVT